MNTIDFMAMKFDVKINSYESTERVLNKLIEEEKERLERYTSEFMKDMCKGNIRAYQAKLDMTYEFIAELKKLKEWCLFGE